jgi:hypothetical protein
MKQTITLTQFQDSFNRMDRGSQFSHEALEVLFNYIEQYEQDCGVEIELDVIALCCEYSEAHPEDIAKNYNIALYGTETPEELASTVLETLYDHTTVAGVCPDGAIVFAQF